MSKVSITGVSMSRCLMNSMPYEIVFDIFRRLPKLKLIQISSLCSKFRDVAGDKRFWKNVYIKYEPYDPNDADGPIFEIFAFEELYSEPWPVEAVDLSRAWINPPVSGRTGQIVKVNKLFLTSTTADKVTTEAILSKYQCTELYLNSKSSDRDDYIMEIAPEVFSKQTDLIMLLLGALFSSEVHYGQWLQKVLSNCKKLKFLDLGFTFLAGLDMSGLVKNLPKSLEKMLLSHVCPEDSFFEMLAVSAPNLKELKLCSSRVECPYLLKFQFLEVLHLASHIYPCRTFDISDLCMYLIRFPALKIVCIGGYRSANYSKTDLEELRTTLEPNAIIVRTIEKPKPSYSEDGNLWRVSFPSC